MENETPENATINKQNRNSRQEANILNPLTALTGISIRIKISQIIVGQNDYAEITTLFPLISARPQISATPFDSHIEIGASLY